MYVYAYKYVYTLDMLFIYCLQTTSHMDCTPAKALVFSEMGLGTGHAIEDHTSCFDTLYLMCYIVGYLPSK